MILIRGRFTFSLGGGGPHICLALVRSAVYSVLYYRAPDSINREKTVTKPPSAADGELIIAKTKVLQEDIQLLLIN